MENMVGGLSDIILAMKPSFHGQSNLGTPCICVTGKKKMLKMLQNKVINMKEKLFSYLIAIA